MYDSQRFETPDKATVGIKTQDKGKGSCGILGKQRVRKGGEN